MINTNFVWCVARASSLSYNCFFLIQLQKDVLKSAIKKGKGFFCSQDHAISHTKISVHKPWRLPQDIKYQVNADPMYICNIIWLRTSQDQV